MSGIGDVWLAASIEDYDDADRLGREYSDELRLVPDDLGEVVLAALGAGRP